MEHIRSIIVNDRLAKHEQLSDILKHIVVIANIKPYSYLILGSYGLILQGTRTINDLDVNMDNTEFEKLKKLNFGEIQPYNNQIRWFLDLTKMYNDITNEDANDFSIEIFQKHPDDGYPDNNFSLNALINNDSLGKDRNDHYYFNLSTVLKWKLTMNREKDQNDIKMARKILKQISEYVRNDTDSLSGGGFNQYKYIKNKYNYKLVSLSH